MTGYTYRGRCRKGKDERTRWEKETKKEGVRGQGRKGRQEG